MQNLGYVMGRYVIVATASQVDFSRLLESFDLALNLAREKENEVSLFLVQNAVLSLRSQELDQWYLDLENHGVEVLVDNFSASMRGLFGDDLKGCSQAISTDDFIEGILIDRPKVIWH